MFIYSFPRPVTSLVEFEGVDDVLPDAVEAAVRHGGDENRLDILGEPRESRLDGSRQRIDKEQDQIGCDPEDDCQRQHPVLDEFPDSSHIRHNPAFRPAEIVKPTDLKNSPPSIGL